MNRRTFLTALVGGSIAAAAALAGIAHAGISSEIETKQWKPIKGENRYQKLIRLQLNLINRNADMQRAGGWRQMTEAQMDVFYNQGDELLAYGMSAFPGAPDDSVNPVLLARVNAIFENYEIIDTMSEAELKAAEDCVINICMAKAMISKYRMPFDTVRMKQFDIFAVKYRHLILQ